VAHRLRRLGYGNVKILKGGLAAWANAGLPLEAKTA
jgi:rhodanese-related sulfurtransferase